MKQFLLSTGPDDSGSVVLTGKDHHYLSRVRRSKVGDRISCRIPGGDILEMLVVSKDDHRMVLQSEGTILSTVDAKSPGVRVHLIQGLPKLKKLDQVVRQAMEAGAWSLYPALMDHCVAQGSDRDDEKVDRWKRIAREAFQQSGASHLLEVHAPRTLADTLAVLGPQLREESSRGLYCHQTDLEQGSLHEYCSNNPQDVFVVIGPEGGISDRERAMLEEHGLKAVLLGPTVLRTETAAIFAIAAVRMITWEASTWEPKPRK